MTNQGEAETPTEPGRTPGRADPLLAWAAEPGTDSDARLRELAAAAFIDPLTGLRNRRALESDLAQRLAVAARGLRPLTVVVGDLDGLKAINDQHGHKAGDQALRALAAALDTALRAGDTAYRIGGDEFLLLLPDTGAAPAEALVERIRAGAPAFSWGASSFPADGASGPDLIELADQRLLAGRNETRRLPAVEALEVTEEMRPVRRIALRALTVMALLVGSATAAALVLDWMPRGSIDAGPQLTEAPREVGPPAAPETTIPVAPAADPAPPARTPAKPAPSRAAPTPAAPAPSGAGSVTPSPKPQPQPQPAEPGEPAEPADDDH